MSSNHRVRFRLWHLFMVVTVASASVCCFTQVGMVTAEIEIIDVGSISEIGAASDDPDAPQEVVNVVFQYVRPDDMADTRLNLFLHAPTKTATRINAGDRFTFRYRARPFLWLKPNKPDPIAIRRLGLNRDDIEEIIIEIRMPGEISQWELTNPQSPATVADRGKEGLAGIFPIYVCLTNEPFQRSTTNT